MFMGEYNHTIDTKGRLIIPAKFREQLGKEFVITKGMDGCLFAYPFEAWREFEGKLKALPTTVDKNARRFSRYFMAGATTVEIDKQGRILVPAVLREFAGLSKEVVLAGVLDRVEIWDRTKWHENSEYDDLDDIAEHMTEFGFVL
jgi:MraZ protein